MCMFTESNMYVWVWSMVSGCDVCTTSAPWLEDSAPAFFLRLALLIAGAEGGWPNRCRHANSDWSRKRMATRICMYVRIYISRYVFIKASKIIIKCIMVFIYVCMYVCPRVSGPVWRAASTWSAQLLRAWIHTYSESTSVYSAITSLRCSSLSILRKLSRRFLKTRNKK